MARPAVDGAPDERRFAFADRIRPDRLLQGEHEPGPDRLDDGRRAALLAMFDIGQVAMLGRVDIGDGATARDARDAVPEQLAAGDEDTRRPRPADELVGRDEDRVLIGQRVGLAVGERAHRHRHVRGGRRVVPERQRAVPVKQDGDRADIAQDTGDVRCGGERSDLQRPIGMRGERDLKRRHVDAAVVILRDDDNIGQRFAPRQLVAVVLVRPDEDDRPLRRRDRRAEVVAIVEVGRQADLQAVDEFVDGAGGPGAREQDDVVRGIGAHGVADDPPGVLAEAGRLEAGPRRFRVRVPVERQNRLADEVLDEGQRAAGRGVVGVRHPTEPERPDDRLVVADDPHPDGLDERVGVGRLREVFVHWRDRTLGRADPRPERQVPMPAPRPSARMTARLPNPTASAMLSPAANRPGEQAGRTSRAG